MPRIIDLDNLIVDPSAASNESKGGNGWTDDEIKVLTGKVMGAALSLVGEPKVTTSLIMAKALPHLTEREATLIFLKGFGITATAILHAMGMPEEA